MKSEVLFQFLPAKTREWKLHIFKFVDFPPKSAPHLGPRKSTLPLWHLKLRTTYQMMYHPSPYSNGVSVTARLSIFIGLIKPIQIPHLLVWIVSEFPSRIFKEVNEIGANAIKKLQKIHKFILYNYMLAAITCPQSLSKHWQAMRKLLVFLEAIVRAKKF